MSTFSYILLRLVLEKVIQTGSKGGRHFNYSLRTVISSAPLNDLGRNVIFHLLPRLQDQVSQSRDRLEERLYKKEYSVAAFLNIEGTFDNVKDLVITQSLNKVEFPKGLVSWIDHKLF